METLTIIGAGNLGKSLGRFWAGKGLLEVRWVVNRTRESAERAVEFIGQGKAIEHYSGITPTDWVMLSVPDDQIESVCREAAECNAFASRPVVFHCSGSQSSSLLEPARRCGCPVASMHPVKSFADPLRASETISGTPCGIEGDEQACVRLEGLMAASGAPSFRVKSDSKLLYHTGTVMVCNYLTALLETGFRCYEAAGIPREKAVELAGPIIQETVQNVLRLGTATALTGPIARGEAQLVAKQFEAVRGMGAPVERIYAALGVVAVELAGKKGAASPEALARIAEILNR